MKPWLLNILACPIDKHHPLDAYFFKWETTEDELEKINRDAGITTTHFKKQYAHLAKQIADGTISPPALEKIVDETGSNYSQELYVNAKKFLNRLGFEKSREEKKLLNDYPEGIDVLYRYLNLVEVEEGLLRCPKCGRWYPIGSAVETIPELMPDYDRERERDLEWLAKWKDKVPEEILREGKPFTL